MNALSSTLIISPNGVEEQCIKFVIDDITKPFAFHQIAKNEQEYTFSAWAKSDGNFLLNIEDEIIDVSSEWARIKVNFVATSSDFKIYFCQPGTYYFFEIQLEEGNTMTSWTPAPEDVDEEFKQYATVTQMNSAIEAAANEIRLSVTGVREAVDGVSEQLKQTEASIELKVDADSLISSINQHADIIELKSNRFVVESDNLTIEQDGTLKTKKGEIGGFVLEDSVLTADDGRDAEIYIEYKTHSDIEEYIGRIQIGNNPSNGSLGGGIVVEDYDFDGNGIYTHIGDVDGGGILIETEEPHDALHIDSNGISRVDGKAVKIGRDIDIDGMKIKETILEFLTPTFYTATTTEAIASGTHGKLTIAFNKTYLHEPIVVIDDYETGYSFIPTIAALSKTACVLKIYNYTSSSLPAGRSVRIRVYGISA